MRCGPGRAVAVLVLLLSGCTSDDGGTREPLIASLPQHCGSLGRPPITAEVTFVTGQRLYAASPDGSDIRCIGPLSEGASLTWGGEADRVAVSTPTGGLVLSNGRRQLLEPGDAIFHGLSRPTGTSLVYISADGRRLFKLPVTGGHPEDISFLARHDEVAYHPSGTSVVVVGEDGDQNYGVFFATNEGTDPQLLAIAEDAQRVYSLAFSHGGRTLYYAAKHEDRYDLHALALTSGQNVGSPNAVAERRLRTLHSSSQPIDDVVVSEFSADPPVAFSVGSCDTGQDAFVWDGESVQKAATGTQDDLTTPVGWLPEGQLLLTTRAEDCRSPGTLEIWQEGRTEPLAGEVTQAAVRAPLPPPPKPLVPATGVVP